MLDWLNENWSLLTIVLLTVYQFVSNLVYIFTNKSKINQNKNLLQEVQDLKFKLPDYREKEIANGVSRGEKFDKFVPEYSLDPKTNTLVQTGELDLVARAQEDADCALKSLLEKFGYETVVSSVQRLAPNCVGQSDEPIVDDLLDDLEEFNASMDYFDDIKDRYGLPSDYSPVQIGQFLKMKKMEVDSIIKKKQEVKDNEKKVVDSSSSTKQE